MLSHNTRKTTIRNPVLVLFNHSFDSRKLVIFKCFNLCNKVLTSLTHLSCVVFHSFLSMHFHSKVKARNEVHPKNTMLMTQDGESSTEADKKIKDLTAKIQSLEASLGKVRNYRNLSQIALLRWVNVDTMYVNVRK